MTERNGIGVRPAFVKRRRTSSLASTASCVRSASPVDYRSYLFESSRGGLSSQRGGAY